jgi:hypothetical protein
MLQVEIRGTLADAPELLKQLRKLGAHQAPGYALVPMRTPRGEQSFIVTVDNDSPKLAASLKHVPDVIEVYSDVPVGPFRP